MRGKKSRTDKYRSRLEARIATLIPDAEYEVDKLIYTVPESKHRYVTDFKIGPRSYIEAKGRLLPQERKKYILVRDQNPDITLRFFFDKSENRIYKGSKTTYAMWAEENGFEWTDTKRGWPPEWD